MTQEEKAKRYDEALEELRGLLEGIREEKCKILEEDITSIFPELKESEDERIRKAIHIYFDWLDGRKDYAPKGKYTIRDMIAWLEKQGEQKPQGKSALEAINEGKVDNANKVEQKPAWSNEDEGIFDEIIDFLENGTVKLQHDLSLYASWLKSLKGRVGCEVNCTTTKEWSVEDMSKIQRICKYLDEAKKYYADITEVRECIDWLKSLKDRYAWRASWEQLDALQYVYRNCNPPLSDKLGWDSIKTLESMYQELKKL